jgi:hypothetical protein
MIVAIMIFTVVFIKIALLLKRQAPVIRSSTAQRCVGSLIIGALFLRTQRPFESAKEFPAASVHVGADALCRKKEKSFFSQRCGLARLVNKEKT